MSESIIQKSIKDHREWVETPSIGSSVLKAAIREVESYLSEDFLSLKKFLSLSLHSAGVWHFLNGMIKLVDGELDQGWKEYERGLRYFSWTSRIHIRVWRELSATGEPYKKPTCFDHRHNLTAALALGEDDFIQKTGHYFETEATERDFVSKVEIDYRIECNALPFWLYCKWANLDWAPYTEKFPNMTLGVYQPLADNWNDEQAFSNAVNTLLDFHLERMWDSNYTYEYRSAPYALIPTEYYALTKVRQKHNLSTPKPEHPLLQAPFGNPPDPLPQSEEGTIFDEAIWRIRKEYPDI